jgi:hypothetical protein
MLPSCKGRGSVFKLLYDDAPQSSPLFNAPLKKKGIYTPSFRKASNPPVKLRV